MRCSIDSPIQFRGPLKVIGPIGGDVQPESASYALFSSGHGAIGYWPKPDVHPDGYWRLTQAEAQFIADACNEKIERDKDRMGLMVRQSQCPHQCDDKREIEDTEGNLWPCPYHGEHAHYEKFAGTVGMNLLSDEPVSGEALYAMMMEVAQKAYMVAYGTRRADLGTENIRAVVESVLMPGKLREEKFAELVED